MTAIPLQHITPDDYKWLEQMFREEFDRPKEIYEVDADIEIIERAERFGFHELAANMRNDIMTNQRMTA